MRIRVLARGSLAWVALGTLLASPVTAQPGPARAVAPSQMIVVSAPTVDSDVGTLTAYERAGATWRIALGPTAADLGEMGVGAPADDVPRTPVGTFPLGPAFGRQPNPGTKMQYRQVTEEDWWDEDQNSPTYNTFVEAPEIASNDAENLYDSGPIYDYAVLIDHNPQRIPGRSAGIFLHVTDGDPTWGCVGIARDDMRSVLRWLDPSASPQITIGVGVEDPPALSADR